MTVEQFNEKYKVGDTIKYKVDSGIILEAKVKYAASRLDSGQSVMWIKGMAGCYNLDRLVEGA